MTIAQLLYLLRWDMKVNRGWSFDCIRAKLLLTELRIEQFIYRNFYVKTKLFVLLWFFSRFFGSIFQWFLCNSNIPGSITIGRGLRLPHPQNIVLAGYSNIGEFCTIYQNVTIAWNGFMRPKPDSPKIGDRVLFGAGAIIIGDLTIGSDVIIAAGTVVYKSVPSCSLVTSSKMHVVKQKLPEKAAEAGSERHIKDPYSIWR